MENEEHSTYRSGGWAGPGAALVLIAIALLVVGWLEVGLMETLLHS